MLDTATKIINLLERLSVVAPERCQYNPNDRRFLMVFVGASAFGWRSATQPTDDHEVKPRFMPESLPHIHYAVLEEAHARGWYSDGCYSWWALYNGKIASAQVDVQIEGQLAFVVVDPNATSLLELEVLPRLECLVLALESQP